MIFEEVWKLKKTCKSSFNIFHKSMDAYQIDEHGWYQVSGCSAISPHSASIQTSLFRRGRVLVSIRSFDPAIDPLSLISATKSRIVFSVDTLQWRYLVLCARCDSVNALILEIKFYSFSSIMWCVILHFGYCINLTFLFLAVTCHSEKISCTKYKIKR